MSCAAIEGDGRWSVYLLGCKTTAAFWFAMIVFLRITSLSFIWLALLFLSETIFEMSSKEFVFDLPELTPQLFLQERQIIRMGVPPVKLEIATSISGVEFDACYENRIVIELDGVEVNLIGLEDLKINKRASGRSKDITDLENLP